ncbi:molybdopterin molybdotransferase MoeA [Microscilla marina]|uniref:Molybdopterin molybdenumtransferase n=1 Tax=Microscilla marina ATCC 23134 TaxID=313606 RepID=A1ZTY2_MICM2|nr:molybdopterin molybdotransferase MoeA [Microscilla marina]EAY26095.1 molybdopterin biosynthesis protein MoeA [Microscilla marina ATCC 23134]
MKSVDEATRVILDHPIDLEVETCSTSKALGRTLREEIKADRDFPPFDRVTMDGIAINYEDWKKGQTKFLVTGVQTAGSPPLEIAVANVALEIMTGAMRPEGASAVVPVEEVVFEEAQDGQRYATITAEVLTLNQNIHQQGKDRKAGDVLVPANTTIDHAEIAVAVTVGKTELKVTCQPKVAIVSTGNELVDTHETPAPYQIRRSNSYALSAALANRGIQAQLWHLPDDQTLIEEQLTSIFHEFDIIITSGGVSKGKKDYVPTVMKQLNVEKLFHRVKQRPGKPMWFGKKGNKVLFGLPGNPVSTLVGLFKYVIPYLDKIEGRTTSPVRYAKLGQDFKFDRNLTYFLSVNVINKEGELWANPVPGHGSGDFANLLECNAFLELSENQQNFLAGSVYPLIPFRNI